MFKSPRREFSVFCTLFYGNKFIILRSQANLLQAVKLNESAQEQKKRIEANAAKEIEIAHFF